MKSLSGVDPKGGVMFVAHLFEGSISDKHIFVKIMVFRSVKEVRGSKSAGHFEILGFLKSTFNFLSNDI